MSAGKNAIPLEEENIEWRSAGLPSFTCECGYSGAGHELLCEEDETTLYCPQCGCAGWVWD